MLKRASCLAFAILLPAALIWANRTAGGYLPKEVTCPVAASRSTDRPADVILLGSSRTGHVFDPVLLSGILAAETGSLIRVERLNSTGTDLVTARYLLDLYLENRGAPKVVVFEPMVSLKPNRPTTPEAGAFWPRHFSLLSFEALRALRSEFPGASDKPAHWYLATDALRRATNLVHGLIKDPLSRRWSLAQCDVKSWSRNGEWAWSGSQEFEGVDKSLASAQTASRDLLTLPPAKRWRWGKSGFTAADYELDASYRAPWVAVMKQIIASAESEGASVVLVPLVNYASYVDPEDRDRLLSLGNSSIWFDVYQEIGDGLKHHSVWRDPHHPEIALSKLSSALLARKILSLVQ